MNQLGVRKANTLVLCAMLAIAGAACGGDANDASAGMGSAGTAGAAGTGSGGASGATATGGAGGASGTSSTAGASGASATGGAGGMMAAPVMCGTATCEPGMSQFQRPCCVDAATSTCGTMLPFGGMCTEPVDPDPRCDSVMFMSIVAAPSCCSMDGKCGLDGAMLGMPGCVSIEDIQAMFEAATDGGLGGDGDGGMAEGDGGSPMGGMGMANPFANLLPAPKACN